MVRRIAKTAAVLVAVVGSATAVPSAMASPMLAAQSNQHASTAAQTQLAVPQDKTDCPGNNACVWAGNNFTEAFLITYPGATQWGPPGFRNVDESFYNNSLYSVRLYYSPGEKGAWVCIKPNTTISDINSSYVFNNGSGDSGYDSPLRNDVASSSMTTKTCTNPIPGD